jgi:hypothetical protein
LLCPALIVVSAITIAAAQSDIAGEEQKLVVLA